MRPLDTNVGGALEAGGTSLIIRPNRSLPAAGVLTLFVAVSALALAIGVGFTLAGAWMVLPFAVFQVLVVGALCRWLHRHADDCELVVVEPQRVRIIKREGNAVSHHEFARYWVRLRWERAGGAAGTPRLLFGSHGKFVSIADHLVEAERARVARELKELLRAPVGNRGIFK